MKKREISTLHSQKVDDKGPPDRKFHPCSWFGFSIDRPMTFIGWAFQEVGRLGLAINDLECRDNSQRRQTVLSDLLSWYDNDMNEALARIYDWRRYELPGLLKRQRIGEDSRPRIELTASISPARDLSVRWYPSGWSTSMVSLELSDRSSLNGLDRRKFQHPIDFHWFRGDEESSFNIRPSNELLFLRGVGNLDPAPVETRNGDAIYNKDVWDSILICAVRAAYEGLVERLRTNFQIDVLSEFEFETQDEDSDGVATDGFDKVRRVTRWELTQVRPEWSSSEESAEIYSFPGSEKDEQTG